MKNSAIIIFGAGPAGLASAKTLCENGKSVLIIEKSSQVGGISKTIQYKNNYFDLGGHRFFSKSKEINELWQKALGPDFLVRPRLSRIYYQNKFFDYPIRIANALKGLGIWESLAIAFDYLKIKIFPHAEEKNFQQWLCNRFGKRLFEHFFKSYTEKVWGVPCDQIQIEWAAQRIKGLSLTSALRNALFPRRKKAIKTLIKEFYYPKYGPGMMYEKMARDTQEIGGAISLKTNVGKIFHEDKKITSVEIYDENGIKQTLIADHFISSLPITALIKNLLPAAPPEIMAAAENLHFRSLITINVILNVTNLFPDNWIYVHSPEVKLGRIQNYKNWSPHMVTNQKQTTLGLEYFCNENDELWNMQDETLLKLGLAELEKIGLGKNTDFLDGFVVRVPNAYPVYDATYVANMKIIKNYLNEFENLQTIGRGGMFRYNNMDHSILTGIYAARNILGEKHDLWQINCEKEYQEKIN